MIKLCSLEEFMSLIIIHLLKSLTSQSFKSIRNLSLEKRFFEIAQIIKRQHRFVVLIRVTNIVKCLPSGNISLT